MQRRRDMAQKNGKQNAGGRIYHLATRQSPEARLRAALRHLNRANAELCKSASNLRSGVAELDDAFADLAAGMSRYRASIGRINLRRLRRASARLGQIVAV